MAIADLPPELAAKANAGEPFTLEDLHEHGLGVVAHQHEAPWADLVRGAAVICRVKVDATTATFSEPT